MQRVDAPEILDSGACSRPQAQAALAVLGRINRWFGGIATTQRMVERVAASTGRTYFSMLEVAAGSGEVAEIVRRNLALRGVTLDITLLDLAASHLPLNRNLSGASGKMHEPNVGVVANALQMPFRDGTFDLVSCNLFTHHLGPRTVQQYLREAARVSRRAVLVNDLIRNPLHLALVYASYPIMLNWIAWADGLTSVRRSYVPEEFRAMIESAFSSEIASRAEISRQYLFRMGLILWKQSAKTVTEKPHASLQPLRESSRS